MRKNSLIKTKILNNSRISFGFKMVPNTTFDRKNKSYSIKYQDNQYKFIVTFFGKTFHFIEMSRLNKTNLKVWNREPVYIKYNNNQTFKVYISISIKTIEKHDFKIGPLIIEKSYENQCLFI